MSSQLLQGHVAEAAARRQTDSSMVSEKSTWGAVPEGFAKIVDGCGNRLVVRQDRADHIDFSICQNDFLHGGEPSPYHGRGALRSKELPNGEVVLIRPYRHGGCFRRVTGEHFFTWPPRPFRELAVTEELRHRGLRTAEVYAACVSRPLGPFYRGWLVTKRLRGAEDFWSVLQSGLIQQIGLETALHAVAESIRTMHRQGVYHADLNLKNILLRVEACGVTSYIIDYDKAKLFLGNLPAALAERNLARLWRSARKLDPAERFFTAAARDQLMSFYYGAQHA